MTVDETVKMIDTLKAAYPRMAHFDDDNVKEVWFTAFEKLDFTKVMKAVWVCIRECEFMPSIAEVMKRYEDVDKDSRKEESEIREYYERTRSYYPGSGDYNYGWEEWLTRVSEASDRVSAARWLNNRITQYVNSCEKETMDFAECIKTIK